MLFKDEFDRLQAVAKEAKEDHSLSLRDLCKFQNSFPASVLCYNENIIFLSFDLQCTQKLWKVSPLALLWPSWTSCAVVTHSSRTLRIFSNNLEHIWTRTQLPSFLLLCKYSALWSHHSWSIARAGKFFWSPLCWDVLLAYLRWHLICIWTQWVLVWQNIIGFRWQA